MLKQLRLKWTWPLYLVALLLLFSAKVDPLISGLFFSTDATSFSKAAHHYYIYHWGVIPALSVGIGSAAIVLLSFFVDRLKRVRLECLFLALSMALGAGIITHLVFKGFWARPRPVQTSLFGGLEAFLPFYKPQINYPNLFKSFPSGHATMGFYFINLILLGIRLNKQLLIRLGYFFTLLMSGLLCYSRVAQGAHFLSDVLMSLVVTWYAALIMDKLVFDFLAKNKSLSYIKD